MRLLWCLLLLLCVSLTASKKVLLISVPVISHFNELNIIGTQLVQMGHKVYQAIPQDYPDYERVRSNDIDPLFYYHDPESDDLSAETSARNQKTKTMKEKIFSLIARLNTQCHNMMREDFLRQLRDIGFDLMIIDGLGVVPCRYIVPYHLGVPYIYQMSSHMEWNMGLPVLPSFTPAFTGIDLGWYVTDHMSFPQRLINLFMMTAHMFIMPFPFLTDNSLLDEHAPGKSWVDLMKKSELFLVTRDHMLEWPGIQLPNVITAPGITIRPARPLPEQLEAIFAAAQHGVVIVSFGSTAGDFKPEVMEALFEGLGQIKQTVVMRYIGDIETGRKKAPPNLHLLSWMPQYDMLAHNNTVAFVTHCGNNGQYEALYNGVPMLGIPLFADQHHNAFRAVSHGYGLSINDITTMKAAQLSAALQELLENKQYRERVQHASGILKSDPILPREKLAYWIDHVMQYGGSHLRPAALDMTFTARFMLDVLAFLAAVSLVSGYIIYRSCRYCCRNKNKTKKE